MLRFVQQRWRNRLQVLLFVVVALALISLLAIEANSLPAPTDTASAITFSRPSGAYDEDISLSLTTFDTQSEILFTTDGTVPTRANSTIYSNPLTLAARPERVVVIRARATLSGGELGPISSVSYFLGLDSTLPMMSIIIDPADLWDEETGIYTHPQERGTVWERPADVVFVDTDRTSGFHIPAGVRVHGGNSRQQPKKPLRLYFRSEYGTPRLEYPLFPQSEVDSFKRLILHAGGNEYPHANSNGTLLRNPLATSLSTEIDGLATQHRPAIIFINGHLWGIYHIRELKNPSFWRDHYGVEVDDEFSEAWFQLYDFVRDHDLRDPAHYAYVQTQIDIENFIDYNIVEFYGGNVEWPHFNQMRYRPLAQSGRWHWLFWDEDFILGLSPYVSVKRDMVEWILPNDGDSAPEGSLLLRKLMKNPEFRDLFLTRLADLLNTTLAPESVIAHIDTLAAELEPDIHYETRRWPASSSWQTSVERMREFARLRPDILRQHFVDGFDLGGTVQLRLEQPLDGSGTIAVNNQLVSELPWQGVYFQGTAVRLTAVPETGYRFAGWETATLPQTPVITLTLNMTQTLVPRFTSITPGALRSGDVFINEVGVDDDGEIQGDWLELVVTRADGVDLRGWRITDNDTKTAEDEGSLIFSQHDAFSAVPLGTSILIVATETAANDRHFPEDDLNALDRELILYVGNGHLDDHRDPWFNLGPSDNVALLAPGDTALFADDQGIAFLNFGPATSSTGKISPDSFGILQDGVTGER